MAVWCEFEEKEFETLSNVALVSEQIARRRNVQVFSPGQVLEKTLGFDFATRIGQHTRIHRRLFGSTPGAPGATPGQLSRLKIPFSPSTRLLNVFIQYKRPELFRPGHRSALWPRTEEYLRFTVSENNLRGGGHHFDQITALSALAATLGKSALVRYACPTVWTKSDLYGLFGAGQLLDNCVFIEPEKLIYKGGSDPYHRRWTFQRSRPSAGRPNPDGEVTSAEDGEAFMQLAETVAGTSGRPEEYARNVLREASELRRARELADSRRAKFRTSERARAASEDAELERDMKLVPSAENESVRASVRVATIARDLGLQWSVIAFG